MEKDLKIIASVHCWQSGLVLLVLLDAGESSRILRRVALVTREVEEKVATVACSPCFGALSEEILLRP